MLDEKESGEGERKENDQTRTLTKEKGRYISPVPLLSVHTTSGTQTIGQKYS